MTAIERAALSTLSVLLMGCAFIGMAHAQVQVTSADPPAAPQGTLSLDVTINGNGFDSSAQVNFFVTGTTNPGGVIVKKVSVRGARKLVATIDITDTAVIDKFDIQVALSGGRKGIGTTLFAVQPKVTGISCSTAGLDFPAFIYSKFAAQSYEINVADSTGQCSRPVITSSGGASAKFSYPVGGAGNVGRIVFPDYDGVVFGIAAVDFTVDGTSIVIGQKYMVAPVIAQGIDLSPDGQTVYYGRRLEVGGVQKGYLYKNHIPSQAGQPGTVLIAESPLDFFDISVNSDETALYANRATSGGGSNRRLERIDLSNPISSTIIASGGSDNYDVAANDSTTGATSAPRFAYVQSLLSAGLVCVELRVARWNGTQIVSNETTGRYSYAGHTWVNGKIVANQYSPPDRKGRCASTLMISQIDPVSGQETTLVRGSYPDGR